MQVYIIISNTGATDIANQADRQGSDNKDSGVNTEALLSHHLRRPGPSVQDHLPNDFCHLQHLLLAGLQQESHLYNDRQDNWSLNVDNETKSYNKIIALIVYTCIKVMTV